MLNSASIKRPPGVVLMAKIGWQPQLDLKQNKNAESWRLAGYKAFNLHRTLD